MTISNNFIEKYSSINYKDLDSETLEAGRNLLIDSLGNIIATLRAGDNKKLNKSIAQSLNENNSMTPLYLGMLIHSLDFDDTHYEALIHTGSITVPSAIYASFNKKISGKDFIKSIILGVDFAVHLASIEKHLFHKKGFHATSVVGVFSSAFIYGYLNKFSKESMVNSLGIAGSFCSGNLSFLENGDNTKIVHPGWASLSGCSAAKLVDFGITGSESIFEDKNGIYNLYSDLSLEDKNFEFIKNDWKINGVSFKPYPICQLSISTIRLASEIIDDLEVNDIKKVIIHLPEDSFDIVAKDKFFRSRPFSPYEAKFSIFWSLATFLTIKELTIDSFHEKYLENKLIENLANKIEVTTFKHTETAASIPGKLEIHFTDGKKNIYEEENLDNSILNSDLILKKFFENSHLNFDDELVQQLLKIEEMEDIGGIIRRILNEQIKKY
tara:strand:- start:1291 stop:2610 length:1320 start_codon:yes stop_codon:yes gene_type:complete